MKHECNPAVFWGCFVVLLAFCWVWYYLLGPMLVYMYDFSSLIYRLKPVISLLQLNAGLQPQPPSPRGQPPMTQHSPSSPRQHQQHHVSPPPPMQYDDSYALVNKPSSQPTTPKTSNHSELDNMLGSLDANMRDQGVTVSTQGVCGACSKPVIGQVRRNPWAQGPLT